MTLDRNTNFNMEQLIARRPFDMGNPVMQDMLAPTNVLALGAIQRTNTGTGKTATVKAGEDIRPALNSLKSAGGGTLILLAGIHRPTYDIVGDSKINITGEGVDQTIIDFGSGAFSIKFIGTSTSIIKNFAIENVTVKNSAATHAVNIQYSDNWVVKDVLLNSNTTNGLYVFSCQYFFLDSVTSDENGGKGFYFYTDENYVRKTAYFTATNCLSTGNTGAGFSFNIYGFSAAEGLDTFTLLNCTSLNDGGNGIEFTEATNNSIAGVEVTMLGCFVKNAGDYSLLVESNISGVTGLGCNFGSATVAAALIEGNSNYFIACNADGRYQGGAFPGWKVTGTGNMIIGSDYSSQSVSQSVLNEDYNVIIDTNTISKNNRGSSPATNIEIETISNLSGSGLVAGNVVVLNSDASGEGVTTTTTQGDDKVFGMSLGSISDNGVGSVLTKGKTKLLKVNGTTDIAIGDFLCTYTVAGIAAKAGAGDMAFAIALEAYTTDDSNGVIDALLITPRKI